MREATRTLNMRRLAVVLGGGQSPTGAPHDDGRRRGWVGRGAGLRTKGIGRRRRRRLSLARGATVPEHQRLEDRHPAANGCADGNADARDEGADSRAGGDARHAERGTGAGKPDRACEDPTRNRAFKPVGVCPGRLDRTTKLRLREGVPLDPAQRVSSLTVFS
jgi:hypothetical protein